MQQTIHLLTKREFADILKISPRTLDRLRAGGEIPEPLAGPGHPRWDLQEVVEWIRAGRPAAYRWELMRQDVEAQPKKKRR